MRRLLYLRMRQREEGGAEARRTDYGAASLILSNWNPGCSSNRRQNSIRPVSTPNVCPCMRSSRQAERPNTPCRVLLATELQCVRYEYNAQNKMHSHKKKLSQVLTRAHYYVITLPYRCN